MGGEESKHGAVTSTKTIRFITDGGEGGKGYGGGGGLEVGGGEIYTYRYTVTTSMTYALRWAAMKAILMFHNCEGQRHRQCPQTTTFEEKGEPKRIRTEVPPLTRLTPYR